MKIKDFVAVFDEQNDPTFSISGHSYSRESIPEQTMEEELLSASVSAWQTWDDCSWAIILVIADKCDCYDIHKERHYLSDYEKGYQKGLTGKDVDFVVEETPICLGAPDKRPCDCEGYKSRCCLHKERKK